MPMIDFRPKCPNCKFSLSGTTAKTCPSCGIDLEEATREFFRKAEKEAQRAVRKMIRDEEKRKNKPWIDKGIRYKGSVSIC